MAVIKDDTTDNGNDLDLGLNIDFNGTDLFEQFHKSQEKGADTKPVDLTTNPPKQQQQQQQQPPKTVKTVNTSNAGDNDDDDEEEVKLDVTNVLEMAKNKILGKTDTTDTGDDNTAGKDKGEGAGAVAGADDVVVTGIFKTVYEHFIENLGYTALTKEDEFDGSAEAFDKWVEKNKEEQAMQTAEGMIEESFINNPNPNNAKVAQDLFKFLLKGGNVADFVETRKFDVITPEFISSGKDDAEKIERAKTVMTNYYTTLNWDAARINKTIKNLETGGALLDMAEETLPEFIKMNDTRKTLTDQQTAQQHETQKNEVREYNTKLMDIIDKHEALGVFEFKTPKEKEAIKEYLFLPTVKGKDGKKIPQYLADIEEARKNPAFTLFQALTIKNKGIDMKKLEEGLTQKVKTDLKSKLEAAAAGSVIDKSKSADAGGADTRMKITDILDFDNLQTVSSKR
jgi:hypothetical protein